MIESITIDGVASFNGVSPVTVDTSKKVVCFYGHNGTGKSTVARSLQDPTNSVYSRCSYYLPNSQDYQVLVYNTDFVDKNFTQDSFDGVFTLGESNVEAEQAISAAEAKITELEAQRNVKQTEKTTLQVSKDKEIKSINDKVFEVKKAHDKKDLDHCLDGVKNSASKFYEKLLTIPLVTPPDYDFDDLAKESKELNDSSAVAKPLVSKLSMSVSDIEENAVFGEVIVASSESYLAALVEKLKNSTWIDKGRVYLDEAEGKCPFCQQALDDSLVQSINDLFDSSYEDKKKDILTLKTDYQEAIDNLNTTLSGTSYVGLDSAVFELAKTKLLKLLEANINKIGKKHLDPSIKVDLSSSSGLLNELNLLIEAENKERQAFNKKLSTKKVSLEDIKKKFWTLTRIKFDSDINAHNVRVTDIEDKITKAEEEEKACKSLLDQQNEIIAENRKKITNIEMSVVSINEQIKTIGLEGFEIKPKEGESNHYYLCRGADASGSDVYKSLSEGEKTLITFLYFLELCQGSVDSASVIPTNKKIIVIDDPISSLSHNYIYEVGSLTHKRLIKGYKYAQIILLTHSLYFLHEIIKYLPKRDDFVRKCSVFRVVKNVHSSIVPMNKDDVKNDYQSYWQVIKDAQSGGTSSIVLPNIMRNILEYYFSFVHKSEDLKKALEELEGTDAEFSPFYRFINRESHSDSVNINDLAEIDASRFIAKFEAVFEKTHFKEHFDKMMA